ncbi:MAG: hypothetical protein IJI14_15690 [Anaerolineaceae bacterium]|nr:hypothetical protein [Anaerolineaceae bacterium]
MTFATVNPFSRKGSGSSGLNAERRFAAEVGSTRLQSCEASQREILKANFRHLRVVRSISEMTAKRAVSFLLIGIAVICFFVFGISGLIVPGAMFLVVKVLSAIEEKQGTLLAVLSGLMCILLLVYFLTN